MARLNNGDSDWPSSKDSYTAETDEPKSGKTLLKADHILGIHKWISNAQDDLGGSLKGSKSDAATRLDVHLNDNGTVKNEVRIVGANGLDTIQNAIDDLPSGGGKVFIPKGTHTITSPIKMKSDVTIEGAGENTIIQTSGAINAILLGDGTGTGDYATCERCCISNLKIDGDGKSQKVFWHHPRHHRYAALAANPFRINTSVVSPFGREGRRITSKLGYRSGIAMMHPARLGAKEAMGRRREARVIASDRRHHRGTVFLHFLRAIFLGAPDPDRSKRTRAGTAGNCSFLTKTDEPSLLWISVF
jgi:hypothetical protein